MEFLREQVTINDVLALHGQVNPVTGRLYKIDGEYFKRNWEKVFKSPGYSWPQETVVIAAQNKLGLVQDGDMGPQTRQALQERQKSAPVSDLSSQPSSATFTDKADQPPPVLRPESTVSLETVSPSAEFQEESWFENGLAWWKRYKQNIFEILAIVVIGWQSARIFRDYRKSPADKEEFLKIITDYVKGGDKNGFSFKSQRLIAPQSRFIDMTAKRAGDKVEIVLRSGTSLGGKGTRQDRQRKMFQVFRKAFEDEDIRMMLGRQDLSLDSLELYDARLHLSLALVEPEKTENNKAATIWYHTRDGKIETLDVPLARDTFKELADQWTETMRSNAPLNAASLDMLIADISAFRGKEKLEFKDFRTQAAVSYKTRALALEMLEKIRDDRDLSSVYKEYFYHLAKDSNMVRYLMAHSATLDSYKSSFLSERDIPNIRFMGLPLDKLSRVLLLVEFFYSKVKRGVIEALPRFHHVRRELQGLERKILGSAGLPVTVPQQPDIKVLTRQFEQYSLGLEKPYANSLVGLDLWRRHEKVIRGISRFSLLALPLFVVWKMGWIVSIWVPIVIGLLDFMIFNYLIPVSSPYRTRREYDRFVKKTDSLFLPSGADKPVTSSTSREDFLDFLTRGYFWDSRGNDSKFVLNATKFSDVAALWENSDVELRFLTDSHFVATDAQGKSAARLRQAIDGGEMTFGPEEGEALSSRNIKVFNHPTGIRVQLSGLSPRTKTVVIRYQGPGLARNFKVAVRQDAFKVLSNQWNNCLAAQQCLSVEHLDGLVRAIHEFRHPAHLKLSDFRKNAGYYHEIRAHALATFEALSEEDPAGVYRKYQDYFLELAHYATETRFLMASFAGMDTLKSRFFPDGDKFRRKIFGIPLAKLLRAIFGVSFLYSWSQGDTKKSISRLTAQARKISEQEAKILGIQVPSSYQQEPFKKKLWTEFENIDSAYRYPAKNSLVGRDYDIRNQRMWVMLFYLGWLTVTMGLFIAPYAMAGINFLLAKTGLAVVFGPAVFAFLQAPQILGVSLVNLSLILYVIIYWVNPIHAHNETAREYGFYQKVINLYGEKKMNGDMKFLQLQRSYARTWDKWFHSLSYLIGVLEPIIVLTVFLYQQVQGALVRDRNGNGQHENGQERRSAVSPNTPEDKLGGIDLRMPFDFEIRSKIGPASPPIAAPEVKMEDFRGFDFHIIELTPILNPAQFILNFVSPVSSADYSLSLNVR